MINKKEDDAKKTSLTVARNGGIAIVSSLLSNVIRFLTQVLLVRLLGSEKYGLYTIGFSIFTIGSQISQVGLSEGIVKFGSVASKEKDQPRLNGLMRMSILLTVTVSILIAVAIFIASPHIAKYIFHKAELEPVLRFFAVSMPFFVFSAAVAALFRATQRIFYYSVFQFILDPLIYLFIVSIFCVIGLTLAHVLEAFVLAWFLVAVFGAIVVAKVYQVFSPKSKAIYEPKKIFRFTIPVYISKFLPLIMNHFDKVILGNMVLASDVGIYSAGGKIAAQVVIFMQAFNLIFSPIIAEYFHDNKIKELNQLFKTVTRWTIILTIPFILFIVINAELIMNMFGLESAIGIDVLILCCLAQFVSVCTGPLEYILIMGKQDLDLINNCFFVVINIILNIFFVSNYGIWGAAISLGLSMIIINLVRLIEIYILFKLWPYSLSTCKCFLAAFIAYSLAIVLNTLTFWGGYYWLISLFLLFGVYAGLLYLMGFNVEDRAVLALIKRKVGGILMSRNTPS
jgi:O-antigen/teichoic acid export membrane protein